MGTNKRDYRKFVIFKKRKLREIRLIEDEIQQRQDILSEELKVKHKETAEMYIERTKYARYRSEQELSKLYEKYEEEHNKLKMYTYEWTLDDKRKQQYKKIVLHNREKPFTFFKNAMLILQLVELKHNIPKEDMLLLMYFHGENRHFTKEEITYKTKLFGFSHFKAKELIFKGYFVSNKSADEVNIDPNLVLYNLHQRILKIMENTIKFIIGAESLENLEYTKNKHQDIKDSFDKVKKELINLRTGETETNFFSKMIEILDQEY